MADVSYKSKGSILNPQRTLSFLTRKMDLKPHRLQSASTPFQHMRLESDKGGLFFHARSLSPVTVPTSRKN